MLNLIKSDLYRITRPRGLRGSFWQYGIAILAAYGIVVALVAFANSQVFLDMTGGTIGDVVTKTSLTVYFADMLNGLVPLCVAFMAVEHALAEFKNGYIKSVLSARSGRLSYITGKLLFVGVLSALMIIFSTLVVLACLPVMTAGHPVFNTVDGPLEVIGWFVGFWLNTWALAACSLILVYATRVSPVSYIGAFCFCASVVPQTLMGLAYSTGGILSVLQPIRPVLETLAAWIPSTALSNLSQGGQLFLNASLGIWGETGYAFTIAPGIQTVLTGIIWIVLAGALVLAISRKRDI
ncbi:hypothetical protein H6A16_08405 [Collinsella tanakaei]|uniref:hypothetical protein n=1 Tax=Collinsella tanakaei TaxID=626935 RepID=UPI00195ED131|nr:hypothetical protein [Collinsella tanakaei]MBM6779507.1 hypothetical protein [Collinsella tanakaei]